MLPTTGFFKNIDCPYHERACDRPYCHFKHRKRNDDSVGSSQGSAEVPTYNPTPKSELANAKTHIPISYVPDLAVRKERKNTRSFSSYGYGDKKPTYKPTPLSILSTGKATQSIPTDSIAQIDSIAQEESASDELAQEDNYDINFDDLEVDLNMLTDIINEANANELKADENKSNGDSDTSLVVTETLVSKSKSKSKDSKETNGSHRESRSSKKSTSHSKKDKTETHKKKEESKQKKSSDKKSKSDNKHSSESSRKSSKHKSSSRDKSSKHKDKSKSKERKKEHGEKEKRREKQQSKVETPKKMPDILENLDKTDIFDDHSDNDADNYLDNDSDFEEDPMAECYKIFTEYKPTEPSIFSDSSDTIKEAPNISDSVLNKKRIAHENADKSARQATVISKAKLPSAAQVMTNRLKMARLQSLAKEQSTDVIAEINKHLLKRPADVQLHKSKPAKITKSVPKVNNSKPSTSCSLVDDIISGRAASKSKRIAPVQNVNSIQRAKAKIDELAKMKAANAIKTVMQTTKGSKRVAHVPEFSVADIPDVLMAERSKLPVNVRSRFLKMIFEECMKLYFSKEEAQDRALSEEYKCYERCSALVTYRNSAMLAISRLRKELQERETAGLGPIMPGDGANSKQDTMKKEVKFYENIKRFILPEEELILHGFPREGSTPGRAIIKNPRKAPKQGNLEEGFRICCRCSKHYRIDKDGFPLYEEECVYHPLKKRTFRGESIYLCCKSSDGTGCATSTTHVSETLITSEDDEFEGYQTTMPPEYENDPRSYQVFALDCEMCYTTKGLELTRVTIVNAECKTVYESLVKPLNPIIDYNTRFSGITKEQMERTATSILQVQANILHLCNSDTILIGHSLESDMKALKIIHSSIIDTSVLFPHKFGLPHKRALRDLAREFLKKIIQNDVSGHDSAEDALTCMELIQWKLKEDFKTRGIKL